MLYIIRARVSIYIYTGGREHPTTGAHQGSLRLQKGPNPHRTLIKPTAERPKHVPDPPPRGGYPIPLTASATRYFSNAQQQYTTRALHTLALHYSKALHTT